MPLSRRTVLRTTLAAATAGLATGCRTAQPAAAPSGVTPAGTGFPLSVEHRYGMTTVPAEPQRVVIVGLTELDACLACGVVPVGVTAWLQDSPDGAVYPWAADRIGGAPLPTVLDSAAGLQMEKIVALAPDLIIAIYSGITADDYAKLSKIAPVIAQPKDHVDFGVPWDVATDMVGRALGRTGQAEDAIGHVRGLFARYRDENPLFEGTPAITALLYEGIWVDSDSDPRLGILLDLGFRYPEGLEEIRTGDTFGTSISWENFGRIDTDLVFWRNDSEADVLRDSARVWTKSNAYAQGRAVYIDRSATPTLSQAIAGVTVLSLPYVLERIVPMFAAAVDGDPATTIPQPAD